MREAQLPADLAHDLFFTPIDPMVTSEALVIGALSIQAFADELVKVFVSILFFEGCRFTFIAHFEDLTIDAWLVQVNEHVVEVGIVPLLIRQTDNVLVEVDLVTNLLLHR